MPARDVPRCVLRQGRRIADRARAAKEKFAGIAEVGEVADFILADAQTGIVPGAAARRLA